MARPPLLCEEGNAFQLNFLSHHQRPSAVDLGSGSFERIRNNDNLLARLVPIVLLDGFTNSR